MVEIGNRVKIHKMAQSDDFNDRINAVKLLTSIEEIPDKDQAWNAIIKLTKDKDHRVRKEAGSTLRFLFSNISNYEQATNDLLELLKDKHNDARLYAANTLCSDFSKVNNKEEVTREILKLANNKRKDFRLCIASNLGSIIPYLNDKEQATSELFMLSLDDQSDVRLHVASSLSYVIAHIEDKEEATRFLFLLANDIEGNVRLHTATAIGNAFAYIKDNDVAWKVLLSLTKDWDCNVRLRATSALGSAFAHVANKEQAMKDLLVLIKSDDFYVRRGAATALGFCLPHVIDKKCATEELLLLLKDQDIYVRRRAATALGSVFADITDKEQAYKDLFELTKDNISDVRVFASYSLGRISIFRATESENEDYYFKELKNAIEFFERSSIESTIFNPAEFCYPFYKSVYSITFEGEDIGGEVNKYLEIAKRVVEASESKKSLLEAIENLEKALREMYKAKENDFDEMKSNLIACQQHCERATDILAKIEKNAPVATKLIRRGLPKIDQQIKDLLIEIQKKAKKGCQQSKGTLNEELACSVNKEVQNWYISNHEQLTKNVDNLVFMLKLKIPLTPKNIIILNEIEKIRNEKDITKQYEKISYIIGLISTEVIMMKKIEISGNSIVGDVIQGEQVYVDKSEKNSFDVKEFSSLIEKILIAIKKTEIKDINTDLAMKQLDMAKFQAENGEKKSEVSSTLNKAVKYLKKSEEIAKSGTEIGKFLIKAGTLLGVSMDWI